MDKKKKPAKRRSQPGKTTAPATSPRAENLLIAGIGASAGGLEAVSSLIQSLPVDTGIAFVLVHHLDPRHRSALVEILSKSTRMPVREAQSDAIVAPNAIYVIPPGTDLTIKRGKLQLSRRPETRTPQRPIDGFLQSLAEDAQDRSVGVILSGTGMDGTLGLKAVKEAGGITFAQDDTATHQGMPHSAVAGDCVDFVLSPPQISAELVRIARRAGGQMANPAPQAKEPVLPEDGQVFASILQLLTRASGIHFTHYKQPTLQRRIERRMVMRRLDSLEAYLKCLQKEPEELEALRHEMLIQVTSFFRDPESFQALKANVLPGLLKGRPVDSPIRIWVAGCATGEEVYSLAICVLEFLQQQPESPPVKIFATDVSEGAVGKARLGLYQESALADVSPERLRQFFVKNDGGHQIAKVVRDLCVFAEQDVTRDPPFSQLDLISCRNVLIYLGAALQNRVIPVFHYALKPNGVLMLGSAESVGPFAELFESIDKKHRFYRRTAAPSRLTFEYPPTLNSLPGTIAPTIGGGILSPNFDIQREADRVVLAKYAPPGVVIDETLQVLQFRGHTGLCLEPAPGVPTSNLLQLAREGLMPDLREAIEAAKSSGLPERRTGVRVKTNSHTSLFDVEVIPITVPATSSRCFVVLFAETTPSSDAPASHAPIKPQSQTGAAQTKSRDLEDEHDRQKNRLADELAATKSYLQSVIESKEAGNEELKAANEEIISSNEELQSTNEELETAKEELQATNEELVTVNDELQNRIRTATQVNDDLTNLIDSVNIPIVILGRDLRLRRFSPSAQKVLNLRPGDMGRHISDFKPKIDVPDFVPFIHNVLDTLAPFEREVKDESGRWYTLLIRPYRTADNKIDGATLCLFDIDTLKQKEHQVETAQKLTRQTAARMEAVVETAADAVVTFDERGLVESFNSAGETMFGYGARDVIGRPLSLLMAPPIANEFTGAAQRGWKLGGRDGFQTRQTIIGRRCDGATFPIDLAMSEVAGEEGRLFTIILHDISERRELEREVIDISAFEQRRIGQDLHDSTGQALSGLSYLARSLAEELETKSPADAKTAALITAELERALEQVRRICQGLIPVEVDSQGLMAALESLAERVGKMSGVNCTFACENPVLVDDNHTATQLFLIAQEAVTNAVKHAKPGHILVRLHDDGDQLTLEVRDDGIGIAGRPQDAGMGLKIMNYRAGLLGGRLIVQMAAEQGGAAVICVLPWNRNHAGQTDADPRT